MAVNDMVEHAPSPPSGNVRERARRQSSLIDGHIREHIASGDWPPGHRLPTDRELARDFSIARNTVRRTLEQLEREQLIIRQVGRGSFVAGLAQSSLDPIDHRRLDASPADIMELRLLVEPQMADLVVLRATAGDIEALDECIRKSEVARSYQDYEKWDEALHRTLARCTKNNGLIALMESINVQRNQPAWINLKKRTLTQTVRRTYQEQHRAIVSAVKKRDRDKTREAIRAHLVEVRNNLLGGA